MRILLVSVALLIATITAATAGQPHGIATCKGRGDVSIDWDRQTVMINGQSHRMQLDKLGKHSGVSLHGDGITLNLLKGHDGAKATTVMLIDGEEIHLSCRKHG